MLEWVKMWIQLVLSIAIIVFALGYAQGVEDAQRGEV